MSRHGLLLIAHGAREPGWAAPFQAIADAVHQARPGVPVQLAYLETMQPDPVQAASLLHDAGCKRVEVLPLFLGSGGHVRRDLPALLDALRRRYPPVVWTLHAPAGESPLVTQAVRDVALALLPNEPGGDEP